MTKFLSLTLFLCLAMTLQAQQTQDSQDSGDTSGGAALVKSMQQNTQATAQLQQNALAPQHGSCKEAVQYVDSQKGLFGDWDSTMNQYLAYKNGIAHMQMVRTNLLSDTWWGRSTSSEVLESVGAYCSFLTDIMGAMTPSGEAIDLAKNVSADFGLKVKASSDRIYKVVANGGDVLDAVKSGTNELANFAIKEAANRHGAGQLASILSLLEDIQKELRREQERADLKATIQEQVGRIDDLMHKYGNDMAIQRERLEAVEALKDAVQSACNARQPMGQQSQSDWRTCNQNWSRKWDSIMNTESRDRLRQTFDQLASGCSQILAATPEQLEHAFQQEQLSGRTFSFGTQVWTSAQWTIYVQGWIEVCNCRQASTQPAPVPITPR